MSDLSENIYKDLNNLIEDLQYYPTIDGFQIKKLKDLAREIKNSWVYEEEQNEVDDTAESLENFEFSSSDVEFWEDKLNNRSYKPKELMEEVLDIIKERVL